MKTEDRVVATSVQPLRHENPPAGEKPRPEVSIPDVLWRAVFVGVGFGIAVTGFTLILSVFLSFIGLPMFLFGLAMMEAGLKGWR